MCTPAISATHLETLERMIDKTIKEMAPNYPFLKSAGSDAARKEEQAPGRLALGALKELRERLSP